MRLFIDPDDVEEIRSVVMGLISYAPTDEQILEVVQSDPILLGSAFMYGWGDTEVRDRLCDLLEGVLFA